MCHHTIEDKKQLLTRVRRIKGQAEALEKALRKGEGMLGGSAADRRDPRGRERANGGGVGRPHP